MKKFVLALVSLLAVAAAGAAMIPQSGSRCYGGCTSAGGGGGGEWADVYVTDVSTIGAALMTDGQKVGVEVGSTTTPLSVQVSAGNGGAIEIVTNGSFDGAENAVRMIPPTTILGGSGNAEHVSWLRFLDLWNEGAHDIAQMNFRVLVYYGPRYYDLAPNAKSWGILATDTLAGGGNTQRSGVFDNHSPVSYTDWRYPFVTVETFSIYDNPYNSSNFFLEDRPASEKLIEIRSSAPSHSASPPQTGGEWICFEHIFDTRQDRGNANGLVKLLVWTRDGLVSAREISGPLTHGNNWNFARRYISQFEGLGFYFNDAGTAHADNYVLYSHATFAANMANTNTVIGPPPGFLQ